MYITVYVDFETFTELVCEGSDFEATLSQEAHEVIQLSVPFDAIQMTSYDDLVLVSREQIRRYENR